MIQKKGQNDTSSMHKALTTSKANDRAAGNSELTEAIKQAIKRCGKTVSRDAKDSGAMHKGNCQKTQ